jgi:acetyl esterase/lipase
VAIIGIISAQSNGPVPTPDEPRVQSASDSQTELQELNGQEPDDEPVAKLITSYVQNLPGNQITSTLGSAINESLSPIGRYRQVVFDSIEQHTDIPFKDTYLTKMTADEGVYTLDFDTDLPTQLKLNIYTPANDTLTKRPLLILMYGGGWTYGDRTQREPDAQYYASLGYVTMTFDYTMVPPGVGTETEPVPDDQAGFYFRLIQEGVADLNEAYNYMIAHSTEYGIDTSRIGVGGWSVGGLMSNTWVHANATNTPFGVKASLPASSIYPHDLPLGFGGYRTFTPSFNPKTMLASYADDEAQNGPYSPEVDCAQLDAIGHQCTTTLFPGNYHEIWFHLEPLRDVAVDFFAKNVAGY